MFKISTLCYLEKGEKLLFLHRTKKEKDINEGMHIGLGGKVEIDESPEECALREVKEEAGVTLVEPVFRGILTFPLKYKVAANSSDYWVTFLYTADKWKGKIGEADEGDLVWVKKDNIEKLNLWEGDKIFLNLLINTDKKFILDFVYDEDKLTDYSVSYIG